jgi:hypothetical protein
MALGGLPVEPQLLKLTLKSLDEALAGPLHAAPSQGKKIVADRIRNFRDTCLRAKSEIFPLSFEIFIFLNFVIRIDADAHLIL